MPAERTIQYIEHHNINKRLWDDCITQSSNKHIYAYSVYLDHMADNWDAIIMDNYKAVMPLPWRKKSGIYYIYQPFLTAQLGLFGNVVTDDLLKEFLSAIPEKFRLWEFSLNHGNLFKIEGYELYERKNFVLDLSLSYDELYKNYRENIRRNIKKSLQFGCYINNDISIEQVASLASSRDPDIKEKDLQNFKILYKYFYSIDGAKCYGVFSKQNELISSAAFLFSNNRTYYILIGNHPNGRTLGASHALVDSFIKDHSGKNLVLDFEGSDIRNLAFFYSSFGAKEENYMAIRLNRLPWYARLFKK
jgi:hypothetical protein